MFGHTLLSEGNSKRGGAFSQEDAGANASVDRTLVATMGNPYDCCVFLQCCRFWCSRGRRSWMVELSWSGVESHEIGWKKCPTYPHQLEERLTPNFPPGKEG